MVAKPFIKWVGGKGRLLKEIAPFFPKKFKNYFEPFVGGGAVFFHLYSKSILDNKNIRLSDMNDQLIETYIGIRDYKDEVLNSLTDFATKNDLENFKAIRALNSKNLSTIGIASRFIYLNKTAFNGMWRVNSSGGFNVPFGRYENPSIRNEEVINTASEALKGVEIVHAGYETVLETAKKGDFVYLDPPYDPISLTASFTSYTKAGFGKNEQQELKEFCDKLTKKGVMFMLSNSDTDFINELYSDYNINKFDLSRSVGGKSESRKKAVEIVVTNY